MTETKTPSLMKAADDFKHKVVDTYGGPVPNIAKEMQALELAIVAERKYRDAVSELMDAVSVEGMSCPKCEGNGALWADGRAHLPSYRGETVTCAECAGTGKVRDQERTDKAIARLREIEARQ